MSTGLPEESANVSVKSVPPLFSSPALFDSVIVRPPDVEDLITFSRPDDAVPLQAVVSRVRSTTTVNKVKVRVFICSLRLKSSVMVDPTKTRPR
jgi:hypothetical protein